MRANVGRVLTLLVVVFAACAPGARDGATDAVCTPGETRACYDGPSGTEGIGACHAGVETCADNGSTWSSCQNETTPSAEVCGNAIDDDCNGKVDEDVDADGDGYTTCGGDCCDSTTICAHPENVNPGAFEVPGDGIDNNCDGHIDVAAVCDNGMASSSTRAGDFAAALDLCSGVVDSALSLPDGTGAPDPVSHAIRAHFGSHVVPQAGDSMVLLSTGAAAGKGDDSPAYHDFASYTGTKTSAFPADFVAANGGKLPNAPGCPEPDGDVANDPVMLTLHVKVPTNAHSFSMKVNFFSAEFPEWTCSRFNDFFVVLLDSQASTNPADKNLAIYRRPSDGAVVPLGTNLAKEAGLFTQCVNGTTGCASGYEAGMTGCVGTEDLAGTGFDDPAPNECDGGSMKGGGTGWLTTMGNVVPGEVITLRIAIWDTGDHQMDSLAVIDDFEWHEDATTAGTAIF